MNNKIALGGGCHWCTEAVFQALKGVEKVEQGFVASTDKNDWFSEAVIVHFNKEIISLATLIEIHLYTHKSTSAHSMRNKYRSAIYTFNNAQLNKANTVLTALKKQYNKDFITKVYPFFKFKSSREEFINYYQKGPEKPFCKRFIAPKLTFLLAEFSKEIRKDFIELCSKQ